MSAAADLRMGWCPGARRPMMAGDGLIVRVKPRHDGLSTAQAAGIAALAERHGSGALNLTRRGNLQIRGVRPDAHTPLLDGLNRLGLLDRGIEAERVRNLVVNPLAEFDSTAAFDVSAAARALEEMLVVDPLFEDLPPKFAFLIDGGGTLGLAGIAADLRFEAALVDGAPCFALRLGGAEDGPAALCAPDDLPRLARTVCHAFAELGRHLHEPPRRMRDLMARTGAAAVFGQAGLAAASHAWPRPLATTAGALVGVHGAASSAWVGAAPAFGRLTAPAFAAIAQVAEREGASVLRLTPWRTVLVPGLTAEGAHALAAAMRSLALGDLVLDPADPRLRVAACAGAPACGRATVDVRAAATAAVALLDRGSDGVAVHVSGCAKGCAHEAAAPVTLVGREGRYDLVRHGTVHDRPARYDVPPSAIAATLAACVAEAAC